MHKFTSSREPLSCSVCLNLWANPSPHSATPSIQSHLCARCNLAAHSNCKSIAKQCIPCGVTSTTTWGSAAEVCASSGYVSGSFIVSVVHAYDLPIDRGTGVYAVLRSGETAASTDVCQYGGDDCVFSTAHGLTVSSSVLDPSSLTVTVEIWSTMSLSNILASKHLVVHVSLVPLLLYPAQSIERWFPMKRPSIASSSSNRELEDNEADAMVLLRFKYEPGDRSHRSDDRSLRSDDRSHRSDDRSLRSDDRSHRSDDRSHRSDDRSHRSDDRSHRSDEPSSPLFVTPRASRTNSVASEEILPPSSPPSSSSVQPPSAVSPVVAWIKQTVTALLGKTAISSERTPNASSLGVGLLRVHLRSAYRLNPLDAADGDYYMTVAVDGAQERRTAIIPNSASPTFDASFDLAAPHYRSELQFTLVESRGDKKVGRATRTVHSVAVREENRGLWRRAENRAAERLDLLDLAGRGIVGHITATVVFEEDVEGLYVSARPRPAPPPPTDGVSVDRLREHISRVGALLRLYGGWTTEYRRLVTWEEPLLSALALSAFLWTCLRTRAEYFLAVPVGLAVLGLSIGYLRRLNGSVFSRQYVDTEFGSTPPTHRPLAVLRVAVLGFRNMSASQSPALVKIAYHPADGPEAYNIASFHPYATRGHSQSDVASSFSHILSALSLHKEGRRDALLQNYCDPWGDDMSYLYPILQPLGRNEDEPILPWSSHPGCVRITVHTMNSYSLSSIIENEPSIGSARMPIKRLIGDNCLGVQSEVDAWLPLEWSFESDGAVDELLNGVVFGGAKNNLASGAEIRVRMQLDLRRGATAEEKELSLCVGEALTDLSNGSSALSALWNVRENVQWVQNQLGALLDAIESLKNLLNWTLPSKTLLVYVIVIAAWLVTLLVPARYIILAWGILEFTAVFIPQPKQSPISIKINNLLGSIPNDVDMRLVYAGERREHITKAETLKKKRHAELLLRVVNECKWKGSVRMKGRSDWVTVFLVFHGKRLIWFLREDDIGEGKDIDGQLVLLGHAGTTAASPIDVREIGEESRLFAVFGKDSHGCPIKKTILCDNKSVRDELRALIDVQISSLY